MKMVPSIGNDGYNDSATQNGFSRGVATVSLRNQTATSTLILINGRRMTPSAYANPNNGTTTLYDLNSIPVSAIERIEVLKDGASAVYGSDAMAGVINFITRKDYQGFEVKALAAANDAGEYKRQTLSATAGFGDFATKGYNVFVGIDYTHKGRSMVGDKTDEDIQAADYRAINLRRNPYGSFLYNNQPWFIRENGATGSRSFPQTAAVPSTNTVNTANCPDSEKIVGDHQPPAWPHLLQLQPRSVRRDAEPWRRPEPIDARHTQAGRNHGGFRRVHVQPQQARVPRRTAHYQWPEPVEQLQRHGPGGELPAHPRNRPS
jgi:iron complex outermembrane receptor protein